MRRVVSLLGEVCVCGWQETTCVSVLCGDARGWLRRAALAVMAAGCMTSEKLTVKATKPACDWRRRSGSGRAAVPESLTFTVRQTP